MDVPALERALKLATTASLPLPVAERPNFIGKWLLAEADGEHVGASAAEQRPAAQDATKDELRELSSVLTAALNAASRSPAWSAGALRAVAHELLKPKLSIELSTLTDGLLTSMDSEVEIAIPDPMKQSKVSFGADVGTAVGQTSPVKLGDPKFKKGLSFLMSRPNRGKLDQHQIWQNFDDVLPYEISRSPSRTPNAAARQMLRQSFRESMSSLFDSSGSLPGSPGASADKEEHARAVAQAAFELYDKDGSGFIDKYELFDCLMELGRVSPAGASEDAKLEYLEASFRMADTNGDGEVDLEEFVEFYIATLDDIEKEDVAREAFDKYDIDRSNTLEKHELFQALLELDLVPGFTLGEKRSYLEAQFRAADTNGDGVVDFNEFVAFYCNACKAANGSPVRKQRRKAAAASRERVRRQAAYIEAGAIFAAAKAGDVLLVRGQWVLERAGYRKRSRERKGRTIHSWVLDASAAVEPLPPRQKIEESIPEAIVGVPEMESMYEQFIATLENTRGAMSLEAVAAVPVVLVSYAHASADHPDPDAAMLRKLAAALAQTLPSMQAWGFEDCGVFVDWSSLYQQTGTLERTAEQHEKFLRAKNQMGVWFAHKQTTVVLVSDPAGATPPLRDERGWPFFEAAACQLFKSIPPIAAFRLPNGAVEVLWRKVIVASEATGGGDVDAEDADAVAGKRRPPMSAPRFKEMLATKTFRKEPEDLLFVRRLYRKVVEDGLSGCTELKYDRLEWGDAELAELGATLCEVSCDSVLELDLSYNDLTLEGLEHLGKAIKLGALSSLKTLSVAHCTTLRALPEAIGELHELQVLNIEGCVGLTSLPKALSSLGGLKKVYAQNCHGVQEELAALPRSMEVVK